MIRQPVVSGRFYKNDKIELLDEIESCFNHELGVKEDEIGIRGKLKGLILPHAGFMFSGPPASYGFTRLKLEKPLPSRVIILGPKHTHFGEDYAVSNADYWQTPLGNVRVDKDFCKELCEKINQFKLDEAAHQFEHSIEVQLPFLQKIYGDKDFSIVPIAIAYNSFASVRHAFEEFRKFSGENDADDTLIIASSDFSHDTPREKAYKLDAEVIEIIKGLTAQEFYDLIVSEDRSVCGLMSISALMVALKGKPVKARLLKYSTSMDVMPHERGVGYAAMAFEESV
ncbi:MAG: AmmeMemoRadiSam system protein B [Candidatus Rifleibacteriota bacterium]